MAIYRENTTKLSEVAITPDMRYANPYGLFQIALEAVYDEREMFDFAISRDFTEAAIAANSDNTILESELQSINENALKSMWGRICDILQSLMEKFEAAAEFVISKLKKKFDYYSKVAKKYGSAAKNTDAKNMVLITRTSKVPEFSNVVSRWLDRETLLRKYKDSDNASGIVQDLKNEIMGKGGVNDAEFGVAGMYKMMFDEKTAPVNSAAVVDMLSLLNGASKNINTVSNLKKMILNDIKQKYNEAKKEAGQARKGDTETDEIKEAKLYMAAISAVKSTITLGFANYLKALDKGYNKIAQSIIKIAGGTSENSGDVGGSGTMGIEDKKIKHESSKFFDTSVLDESIVNEDEFTTDSGESSFENDDEDEVSGDEP